MEVAPDSEQDFQFHVAKLLSNMCLEAWVYVEDSVASGSDPVVVAARCHPDDAATTLWRLTITPAGALVFEVRGKQWWW